MQTGQCDARHLGSEDSVISDNRNSWEPDAASGYLYNAVHRHYYEPTTGMYYGGDPPAWTLKPAIPAEAVYSDGSGRDQGER